MTHLILFVEDSREKREMIELLAKEAGLEARGAGTFHDFLVLVNTTKESGDLSRAVGVIVDWNFPRYKQEDAVVGMGRTATARLKAEGIGLPVAVFSSEHRPRTFPESIPWFTSTSPLGLWLQGLDRPPLPDQPDESTEGHPVVSPAPGFIRVKTDPMASISTDLLIAVSTIQQAGQGWIGILGGSSASTVNVMHTLTQIEEGIAQALAHQAGSRST
jgi:CheY-like chemotaxis protein